MESENLVCSAMARTKIALTFRGIIYRGTWRTLFQGS